MNEKRSENQEKQNDFQSGTVEEYDTYRESEETGVETFDNQTITLKEKPKKNAKIVLSLLSIIGIAAIAYLVFCFCTANPKYVLVKSLDSWTEALDSLIAPIENVNKDITWEKMTSKGTAKLNIEMPIELLEEDEENKEAIDLIQKLNQMVFNLETQIDKTNQKAFMNFSSNLGEEKILDITYVNQNKKQYLLLKEVLEKYLELEEEADIFEKKIDENIEEEAEYVWQLIKKSLKKNIKSSYTTTESAKIIVDGKTINTTKMTLVLNGKNLTELLSNIIKDIKADERANSFITNLYPEFANYEVILSNNTENGLYYSTYITKGLHQIVKTSIEIKDNKISLVKGKNVTFELESNGNIILTATLKEENDGFNLDIQSPENTTDKITISGKKENEKAIYELNMNSDGIKVDGNLNLAVEKNNDAYIQNGELSFSVSYQGVTIITVKLNTDTNISEGADIKEIKDAIKIEELTEEEQEKVMSYINSAFEKIMPGIFDKETDA